MAAGELSDSANITSLLLLVHWLTICQTYSLDDPVQRCVPSYFHIFLLVFVVVCPYNFAGKNHVVNCDSNAADLPETFLLRYIGWMMQL